MLQIHLYTEFLIINISTEEIQKICLPVKESNMIVGNVANNSLRRDPWLNTKGQYMKESNTLVDNVACTSLGRELL